MKLLYIFLSFHRFYIIFDFKSCSVINSNGPIDIDYDITFTKLIEGFILVFLSIHSIKYPNVPAKVLDTLGVSISRTDMVPVLKKFVNW